MNDTSKSPIDQAHEKGEFEILSFRKDLERGGSGPTWLSHLILEGLPRDLIEKIADAPGWDSDRMAIALQINGVYVMHADFEKICSYFADRMLKEKLERASFDDFEKAVEIRAKGIIKAGTDTLQEKLHDLHQQLENLTGVAGDIVQREWDAPFAHQITDDMQRAALNALGRYFSIEPDVDFEGKSEDSEEAAQAHAKEAIKAVYCAMVNARDKKSPRTIKLPNVRGESLSIYHTVRMELMEEIKESLAQQGLLFEEDDK